MRGVDFSLVKGIHILICEFISQRSGSLHCRGEAAVPIIIHRYVPVKAASLVPSVGCFAVSALVSACPGVTTLFDAKISSSFAFTVGENPGGVCAVANAASSSAVVDTIDVNMLSPDTHLANLQGRREASELGEGRMRCGRAPPRFWSHI